MHIDFHHGTTYVLARMAGFDHKDAETIAYASQYVDDAISSGPIHFENQAMYSRISSAHKMIDVRNGKELANHLVWVPFHFLPGNAGLQAENGKDVPLIERLVCKRNSYIAQDMVAQAILEKGKPYGLHRLGITMHVFADTWAHENFAGVNHPINDVEDAVETGKSGVFDKSLWETITDLLDDAIPPLGHGRATTYSDMPFLKWEYEDWKGETLKRDNTEIFCDAADEMCKAMQRYQNKPVSGLTQQQKKLIKDMFMRDLDKEGEARHKTWMRVLKNPDNYFGIGPVDLSYSAKGKNSWKQQALGTSHDLPAHKYDDSFLTSDWKMFHDALQAHRFFVIHELLPKYGICAA